VRVEGGYLVLNYMRYRDRDYTAASRAKRYRERLKASRRDVVASHPHVTQAEYREQKTETEKEQEHGAQNAPAQQRGGGLMLSPKDYARLLQHNAYVGARLRVPTKLHGDFLAALGGLDPDGRLRGWYANVDAEIEASGEAIVPDVWKWLDRRFRLWAQEQAGDAEMAKFLAGGA
jgi:hypothetical protein